MVAYSFNKRFVEPIRAGLNLPLSVEAFAGTMDKFGNVMSRPPPKRQTIRAIGKRRHARPGQLIQLYCGMRTKGCFLIGEARCTRVRWITIWFGVVSDRPELTVTIEGEKRLLGPRQLAAFARADGFVDAVDMASFWIREHRTKNWKFDGKLIEWEPIRAMKDGDR